MKRRKITLGSSFALLFECIPIQVICSHEYIYEDSKLSIHVFGGEQLGYVQRFSGCFSKICSRHCACAEVWRMEMISVLRSTRRELKITACLVDQLCVCYW